MSCRWSDSLTVVLLMVATILSACTPPDEPDGCAERMEVEPNNLPTQALQVASGCTRLVGDSGTGDDTDLVELTAAPGILKVELSWRNGISQNDLFFDVTQSTTYLFGGTVPANTDQVASGEHTVTESGTFRVAVLTSGTAANEEYVLVLRVP